MQVESGGLPTGALELHAPAPVFSWDGAENGSVMGGTFWREKPGRDVQPPPGDGGPRAGGFSWLDLYLMGLATPEEVPDMFHPAKTSSS